MGDGRRGHGELHRHVLVEAFRHLVEGGQLEAAVEVVGRVGTCKGRMSSMNNYADGGSRSG